MATKKEKSLERKLKVLEKELEDFKKKEKKKKEFFNWTVKKFLLGQRLEDAINSNLSKVENREVPNNEEISNLIGAIIRKILKTRLITILIAIIPIILLFQQNRILNSQSKLFEKQNEKVDKQNLLIEQQNSMFQVQNNRLEQQTYLVESQRRATLSFEFNSILNRIDEQLSKEKKISSSLLGRIVAISRSLKPYKYLDNRGTLISKPLSPERAQLLTALTKSDLDKKQLQEIFEQGDFSYADLGSEYIEGGLIFTDIDFTKINLNKANLRNVQFTGCKFIDSNLKKSNLFSAFFINCILDGSKLSVADLAVTHFWNTSLKDVELGGNDYNQIRFKGCYLPHPKFIFDYGNMKSNLANNVDFDGAFVPIENWFEVLAKLKNSSNNGIESKRLPPENTLKLITEYRIDISKVYNNKINPLDKTSYYKVYKK